MKLPIPDLPTYSTVLPISGEKIKYRPYKVKEQNILKYAAQSGTESDYEDAIKQILENCASVDVEKLHPADFEWIFLKIHGASEGNIVEVVYSIKDCDNENCPCEIPGYFDIDQISLNKDDILNCPFKRRGETYIIEINETMGLQLKKTAVAYDDDYKTLYQSLVSIYDGETVYPKSSITLEEFEEFVDELPKTVASEIKKFFFYEGANIKCTVVGDCMTCRRRFTQEVNGLKDFFV